MSNNYPKVTRIILSGEFNGNIKKARNILIKLANKWPKNTKTRYLITCGGFINFKWPDLIDNSMDIRKIPQKTLKQFYSKAQNECDILLDSKLRQKLKKCTRYITIGIDSTNAENGKHIELVTLLDLKSNKYYWTGKFYPTVKQQNKLVRINDLESHFLTLDNAKVLVLGCHDLNVFNPRAKAKASGWRKGLITSFTKLMNKKNPVIVLHHPHFTDSANIWRMALNELIKRYPSVKIFASAGRYYYNDVECRSPPELVIQKTKVGETMDFYILLFKRDTKIGMMDRL